VPKTIVGRTGEKKQRDIQDLALGRFEDAQACGESKVLFDSDLRRMRARGTETPC